MLDLIFLLFMSFIFPILLWIFPTRDEMSRGKFLWPWRIFEIPTLYWLITSFSFMGLFYLSSGLIFQVPTEKWKFLIDVFVWCFVVDRLWRAVFGIPQLENEKRPRFFTRK